MGERKGSEEPDADATPGFDRVPRGSDVEGTRSETPVSPLSKNVRHWYVPHPQTDLGPSLLKSLYTITKFSSVLVGRERKGRKDGVKKKEKKSKERKERERKA